MYAGDPVADKDPCCLLAFPSYAPIESHRMHVDRSEGWDEIAERFVAARSDTGVTLVRSWARDNLQPASSIVDIGCGSGVPVAQTLIEDGFTVFGIDASAKLVDAFRHRFPNMPSACEAAQDSPFFSRTFDAAVAIGLLFLLSADDQRNLLNRVAKALRPAGRLLFSAPLQECEWQDMLTRRRSRSLGQQEYDRLLGSAGLRLLGCHADEGGNNYYDAIKRGA